MNKKAIIKTLLQCNEALFNQSSDLVPFTGDSDADRLLNDIHAYPHAYVIACLMARQWAAKKCWLVPYRFSQRIGTFEFSKLLSLSQADVTEIFLQSPPLHRMKEIMSKTFYGAIQRIQADYAGDASKIWVNCPSSATIVRRFLEFEGAGPKIATMAANILVRDLKIPVSDKFSSDISADTHIRRVFGRLGLINDGDSNEIIIYVARELNPAYPGAFDLPAWEIGQSFCRPHMPKCSECYMNVHCPTANRK